MRITSRSSIPRSLEVRIVNATQGPRASPSGRMQATYGAVIITDLEMKTESVFHHSRLDIDLNLEGFSLTPYNYVNGGKMSDLLNELDLRRWPMWGRVIIK